VGGVGFNPPNPTLHTNLLPTHFCSCAKARASIGTLEGLNKFVAFKASIDLGLSELLLNEFSDIIAIERPLIKNQIINNPYWLAGFVSGDFSIARGVSQARGPKLKSKGGCFQVNIFNSTNKIGKTVRLFFTITQNFRVEALMNTLINYLGCCTLYKNQKKHSVDYKVTKINDLIEKIIPFFEKYKLLGIKTHDFEDLKKKKNSFINKKWRSFLLPIGLVFDLPTHSCALAQAARASIGTTEGFYIISGLKSGMNTKRELKTSAIRAEKNKRLASHSSILKCNCNNSFLNKRNYCTLNKISEHVPKHKSDFTDNEFGHFLAGLIEGDG
jgi:LAGLIDADG endonuclease